jgi:hypothetical protein
VFDPYLVVANAMPNSFVPILYIWLGATLSICHVAAISLFITIP